MRNKVFYSIMDELDDPMEDMKRRKKIFFVCLFFICFLALIGWMGIKEVAPKYTGREEYYEVDGMQIPTLYKYTKYADIFAINEENNSIGVKVKYIVIFYNKPIPDEYINTYSEELEKLGYKKIIHEGTELYVLNNEDNSGFRYIYVGGSQAKYGFCTSGTYQQVLKESRIK